MCKRVKAGNKWYLYFDSRKCEGTDCYKLLKQRHVFEKLKVVKSASKCIDRRAGRKEIVIRLVGTVGLRSCRATAFTFNDHAGL